jgi:mono/diheme cytochrome c family protein
MGSIAGRCTVLLGFVVTLLALPLGRAEAQIPAQIVRGEYLVTVMGCGDCHTPGYFHGKPDMTRNLGGSDVAFAIPGLGVFVPPNLTPDKETGLGKWTTDEIVTAVTTGKLPDGRMLAPIMPWRDFSRLKQSDALAIAAYLESLTPVKYAVPGPFNPGEKVDVSVMTLLRADTYNNLPEPVARPIAEGRNR